MKLCEKYCGLHFWTPCILNSGTKNQTIHMKESTSELLENGRRDDATEASKGWNVRYSLHTGV